LGFNYVQERQKVAGILNNRRASDAQIAGWMQSGLQRIQRELRCPMQECILPVTIQNDYDKIAVPTDFIELIDILNQCGERCVKEDITRVLFEAKTLGNAQHYYRYGSHWVLGWAPKANDALTVVYYQQFAPLVNDTDTNILLQEADDLLCYATLGFAATFFTDQRKQDWENEYQRILGDLQGTSDADELSGAAAVTPAWNWPDDSVGYGLATVGSTWGE
jgi:hypothetical protein